LLRQSPRCSQLTQAFCGKRMPLWAGNSPNSIWGKVLGHYKMSKHFECKIGEGRFVWSRRGGSIEQEEKLDGIYVLRTSEPADRLSAEDTVRSYKSLAEVERAFRCLKGAFCTPCWRGPPRGTRTTGGVESHSRNRGRIQLSGSISADARSSGWLVKGEWFRTYTPNDFPSKFEMVFQSPPRFSSTRRDP